MKMMPVPARAACITLDISITASSLEQAKCTLRYIQKRVDASDLTKDLSFQGGTFGPKMNEKHSCKMASEKDTKSCLELEHMISLRSN